MIEGPFESQRSPLPSLESLSPFCAIERDDIGEDAYKLTFSTEEAITTIRIVFNDWQSKADLVITNMTTLPVKGVTEKQTDKGYGSAAIRKLIAWAQENNLKDIQAVQVQPGSEQFWRSNGFEEMNNETNDFKYTGGTSLRTQDEG